jgi:hypothetical protein
MTTVAEKLVNSYSSFESIHSLDRRPDLSIEEIESKALLAYAAITTFTIVVTLHLIS